jgi:uncharacterized protein YdcH (DUF465 family)
MTYKNRIAHLEQQHHLLDKQIAEHERSGKFTDNELHEMKKQKLHFKDEIAKLERLMQETGHE